MLAPLCKFVGSCLLFQNGSEMVRVVYNMGGFEMQGLFCCLGNFFGAEHKFGLSLVRSTSSSVQNSDATLVVG